MVTVPTHHDDYVTPFSDAQSSGDAILALRALPRWTQEEILEDELPIAAGKCAAANGAVYSAVVCRGRFYPNDLVKGITVWALKGERLSLGHRYKCIKAAQTVHMSKGDTKLVVAESRTAEARRIVTRQSSVIAELKASGQPSLDAEQTLLTYIGALKHLEAHEAIVRADISARKHQTKKGGPRRIRSWRGAKLR